MTDNITEVFAEDIEAEQWQMLLQYTYADNIKRYLSSRNMAAPASELIEFVGGSITQAYEYFSAAKSVTLNTSPLLYYYGVANLMAGVFSLMADRTFDIGGHGLDFELPETRSRFADLIIKTRWEATGAFRTFSEVLDVSSKMEGGQSWTLLEILGSIPELLPEFERCYPNDKPYVIPVEVVKSEDSQFDRIALSAVERFEDKDEMLQSVEDYSGAYLNAYKTNTYLVMRYCLTAKEIGIYSISGQKFLPLVHAKGSTRVVLPTILYSFMGLYALGFVSRYRPQDWTPFVRQDDSGERSMLQRFVHTLARIVPNLVLNMLHQSRLSFVAQRQGTVDLSATMTPEKVRDIVRREMRGQ